MVDPRYLKTAARNVQWDLPRRQFVNDNRCLDDDWMGGTRMLGRLLIYCGAGLVLGMFILIGIMRYAP